MKDSRPILVTVSGGRTSAFMAICLKLLYTDRKVLYCFANTGREKEETLVFSDRLDHHYGLGLVWLEADIRMGKGIGTAYRKIDFSSASRKGEPFAKAIRKYGLPSRLYRHCTRELKERPIHRYANDTLGQGYLTAIGIRADEKHRLSTPISILW